MLKKSWKIKKNWIWKRPEYKFFPRCPVFPGCATSKLLLTRSENDQAPALKLIG